MARQVPQPQLVQRSLGDLAGLVVHREGPLEVAFVLEARQSRLDAHHVPAVLGDERLDPLHGVGVGEAVPEAEARHPVDLREGSGHEHVGPLVDPLGGRPVPGLLHQLVVGLVDEEEDRLGGVLDPRVDLGAGRKRRGRVVRVTDVDHRRPPGPLRLLPHAS